LCEDSSPAILGISGAGLGDLFRTVEFALYLNAELGYRFGIYPYWHGHPGHNFRTEPYKDREALCREILSVFEGGEAIEVLSHAPLDKIVFSWDMLPWHFPYRAPRVRWSPPPPQGYRRLACQFDGNWNAAIKNPPPAELERLCAFAPGYEFVRLGKHFSVQQCLEALAVCDFFFGVDSGMMQLAYATGTPAFLISYKQDPFAIYSWHADKSAIWCTDTENFIVRARLFLGLDP
jgi:hypothetical protein